MSYASIIQQDLPLAVWELEEAPSSGGAIACDRFLGTAYNGSYTTGTAQTEKRVPLIFGSSRSVQITANNGSPAYAFQIPSLNRLSSITKNEPVSIEFWIKFYSASFSAPTTMTKIMGKPNSETGVYIHNSSIVALVGDTAGQTAKAVVQVPNIKKPLHVVMTFFKNTVSLSVNGQTSSSTVDFDVFTKAYSSSDEFFRFQFPGTNLQYAIDHIAIYSRVLDIPTIKRHMVYGLGYEMPNQVARAYGGYRYNMSMVQTPASGRYEKGDDSSWSNPFSVSNMIVENGYLRIEKHNQPTLRFASDKTSSVFTWDATEGLKCAAGGYVEIRDILSIATTGNYGFGSLFYKAPSVTKLSSGQESTLMYIDHKFSSERYVRFYLVGTSTGENLNVQIDNNTPVTLLSNASAVLSGLMSCGFYYNSTNQELTVFAGYNTNTGVSGNRVSTTSNTTFDPQGIRFGSTPVYSDSENYALSVTAGEDKRFVGGIKRINHFTSVPSTSSFTVIQTAITSTINNYVAEVDSTTKRFVMMATGSYTFNIDLKKLASTDGFVGNHRIEWGSSSSEVTVTALGKGYAGEDSWLGSTTITNGSSLGTLIDEAPGTSKYLNITISVSANDIEHNPTRIYYFRIVTYPTTFASSLYTTTMVSDGPNIKINSTAALPNIPPSNTETPFLFDEEQGGLYVAKTATIPYIEGALGIRGISFFINPSSSTTNILSVVDGTNTASITASSGTLTVTGGSVYINGSTTPSTTITAGVWSHVVFLFTNRQTISSSTLITFGPSSTGTGNFYLDEVMTLDSESSFTTADVTRINNLYKGGTLSIVGDYAANDITFRDSESYIGSSVYQPIDTSVTFLEPVNFVSSVKPGTYTGAVSELIVDGRLISAGDRILVPSGVDSGIYTVNSISIGSALVGAVSNPANSTVYVSEGNVHAGRFYARSNSSWQEVVGIKKINSYSIASPRSVITPISSTPSASANVSE